MPILDPYSPLEGVTRLYYGGIDSLTTLDSSTTLPLFLEWSFPHYDFNAPLGRKKPTLRPVMSSAGMDRSWHTLPDNHESAAEPVVFRLQANLLSAYVGEFTRFVSFESPACSIGFDPSLRDTAGSVPLSIGGTMLTVPSMPAGYRLLNIERLYRKPAVAGTPFGRRYLGCYVDPGRIEIREDGFADGVVNLRVEVQCWGDIQTMATFTVGMNVFGV